MTRNHRAALFARAEALTLEAQGIAATGYYWDGDALVEDTDGHWAADAEVQATFAWSEVDDAQQTEDAS